jgi:hypothetical protein
MPFGIDFTSRTDTFGAHEIGALEALYLGSFQITTAGNIGASCPLPCACGDT